MIASFIWKVLSNCIYSVTLLSAMGNYTLYIVGIKKCKTYAIASGIIYFVFEATKFCLT